MHEILLPTEILRPDLHVKLRVKKKKQGMN